MRVHNFSAGPAMLPTAVLERAQGELLDWDGSGMSVMEVSHRGAAFVACAERVEASLRSVLDISDDYACLFLQGGAYGMFAATPLNLSAPGDTIAFLNTGDWSTKAIAEAGKYAEVAVLADTSDSLHTTLPRPGSYTVPTGAAYLHYTPNETIRGVEFDHVPDSGGVPLVADLSSTILSRPFDVDAHGVIYAGAQKNMGPSGLVVVIVRRDLLGRPRRETPTVWDWTVQAKADSMVNTPPTFGLYLLGLTLDWVQENGGLAGMAARNQGKASLLYDTIDRSSFYSNPVDPSARSWMNVPFVLADPTLDSTFLNEADAAGLTNLAGHRSVGGMRASIYNAMPLAGVRALVDFMQEFERTHG
ncbi:MAG: 3-phosphoserine/phosphohydroxythreonine transaminase [Propionibacteriaceae bacterium]|nr:3-phosphoserine/phosphohydroxythreonine transaminase [Propionibacteriaceae bacterium]